MRARNVETELTTRRGRPQRRKVAESEVMREAMRLARKRARLEEQLAALTVERYAVTLELRCAGLSVLEVAELLEVSKGRVQQLVHEAHQAEPAVLHDTARCPYPELHAG